MANLSNSFLRANQKWLRREALSVFKFLHDRFARCIGLRLQSLSTHTPSEAIRKNTERCSATHNELALYASER